MRSSASSIAQQRVREGVLARLQGDDAVDNRVGAADGLALGLLDRGSSGDGEVEHDGASSRSGSDFVGS